MARMRLDKMLSRVGAGSRSQLRKLAREGRIRVGGQVVRDSGMQIDPERDIVELDGERVRWQEHVYIMLHKPPGVVSATEDRRDRTVLDLLDERWLAFDPFPVGRLDKDTEGLLLITSDGTLAHRLLSPRRSVPKTYFAKVEGCVDEQDAAAFAQGVRLDDGYKTLPAELEVLYVHADAHPPVSEIRLTITEGKFHQVKRMFRAVGKKVVYLKRIRMGPLWLDESLPIGQARELTEQELADLIGGHAGMMKADDI